MAAIDAQWRLLACNRTYAAELARLVSRPVGVGMSLLELTSRLPDLQREFRGLWGRALEGERFTVERRVGGDSVRVFEVAFGPIRGADGAVVGATHVGRDVTERRRTEQALRESEERYRILAETAPDGVYAYSEGRIIFANREAARLLAFGDPAALVGRSAWDVIHLDSIDAATARSCRLARCGALSNERNELTELTFRRIDGTPVPVEVVSSAITIDGRRAVQVAIRDVSERRAAERALRRERELLKSILDTIPVMIVVYRPDTRVLQLNPAFERLTGWSNDEAHDRDVMAECYPDPAYREEVRAFMGSLEPGWRDIDMRAKDGRTLHTSWANIRLSDDTHVGIGIDIGERKLGEERLRLLLLELNHRVKNLLAAVQSIAMQSLHDDRSVAEARNLIGSRLRALAQAHELLTDRGWQGIGLKSLVAIQTAPFGERIRVAGDDLVLTPRAGQTLCLILHELATNAVKYGALSTEEGRVDLRWTVASEDGREDLQLLWLEQGGPPVVPPQRKGFGRRLVEQIVPHDLGGRASLEFHREGVRYRLSSPLAGIVATEPLVLSETEPRSGAG
jgi:PAS domain S-box-containing protein